MEISFCSSLHISAAISAVRLCRTAAGRHVNRASDIRVQVRLTLAEIANGVTKSS